VPAPDLVALFVAPLNDAGVRYMVSGAVAAIIYGEPRLTNDIDVVAELDSVSARTLMSAFDPDAFYVPPLEVVDAEIDRARDGHFNVIHTATSLKLDVYPAGDEPLNKWGLDHRRPLSAGGHIIWTAPPEYVVLLKLRYWHEGESPKHAGDIRAMLRALGGDVDRDHIEREAAARGLAREWRAVRES
jgi:hypothetical protein